MKRLKEKWGISSNFQIIIIILVFASTGSLTLWISKPVLDFLSINNEVVPSWMFWTIRCLIIFPIYQILILVIGTLFGQFRFFWAFEKKMLSRLGFKTNFDDKKMNS